jgi:hypothetical protein
MPLEQAVADFCRNLKEIYPEIVHVYEVEYERRGDVVGLNILRTNTRKEIRVIVPKDAFFSPPQKQLEYMKQIIEVVNWAIDPTTANYD